MRGIRLILVILGALDLSGCVVAQKEGTAEVQDGCKCTGKWDTFGEGHYCGVWQGESKYCYCTERCGDAIPSPIMKGAFICADCDGYPTDKVPFVVPKKDIIAKREEGQEHLHRQRQGPQGAHTIQRREVHYSQDPYYPAQQPLYIPQGYPAVLPGPPGPPGPGGRDGRDGKDGHPGHDGQDGQDGHDGQDGQDGNTGAPGAAAASSSSSSCCGGGGCGCCNGGGGGGGRRDRCYDYAPDILERKFGRGTNIIGYGIVFKECAEITGDGSLKNATNCIENEAMDLFQTFAACQSECDPCADLTDQVKREEFDSFLQAPSQSTIEPCCTVVKPAGKPFECESVKSRPLNFLGYSVQGGCCSVVFGCDNRGFTLFRSPIDCIERCFPDGQQPGDEKCSFPDPKPVPGGVIKVPAEL